MHAMINFDHKLELELPGLTSLAIPVKDDVNYFRFLGHL